MKILFAILTIFFSCNFLCFAQDVIFFADGTTKKGKVDEITPTEIKYLFNSVKYTVFKKDVLRIKYENGDDELFRDNVVNNKRMYIWVPKKQNKDYPTLSVNQSLKVIIIDKRVTPPPKSIIDFTGDGLIDDMKNIMSLNNKNVFFSKSDYSVKIEILNYEALFYTGWWHTQTRYVVTIFDNNKKVISEKEIDAKKGFYNVGGVATAKQRLSKSYFNANTELINYLNDNLNRL